MTEQNNLEGLTRTEIERYKALQKEALHHFLRSALAYPLLLNIEYLYLNASMESAKNNPESAYSDNIFAAVYGLLFIGTAINFILGSIDNYHTIKEIKELQKKVKPQQNA